MTIIPHNNNNNDKENDDDDIHNASNEAALDILVQLKQQEKKLGDNGNDQTTTTTTTTTTILKIDVHYFSKDDSRWQSLLTALRDVPPTEFNTCHYCLQFSRLADLIIPTSTDDDDDDDKNDDDKTSKQQQQQKKKKQVKINPFLEDLFSVLAAIPKLSYYYYFCAVELLHVNAAVLSSSTTFWTFLEHESLENLTISIILQDCNMRLLNKLSRSISLKKLKIQLLWKITTNNDENDNNKKSKIPATTTTTSIEAPLYLLTNSKSLEEIIVEVVVVVIVAAKHKKTASSSAAADVTNHPYEAQLSERKWIGLCRSLHSVKDTSKLRVLDMKTISIPDTETSMKALDDLVELNYQLEELHVKIPEEVTSDKEKKKKKKNKKKDDDTSSANAIKTNVETITWMA